MADATDREPVDRGTTDRDPAGTRIARDRRDATQRRRDATQRIRIGLTGLAGVLVLVLLAAAMLGLRSGDSGASFANGSRVPTPKEAAAETPKDPLAELGVTPGGSSDPAPVTPAPAPSPALPARQPRSR